METKALGDANLWREKGVYGYGLIGVCTWVLWRMAMERMGVMDKGESMGMR